MTTTLFSGSYASEDVHFLLKPMEIQDTPVHVKEALIQSGQKHYSEVLTHESLPTQDYLQLFHQALAINLPLLARDVLCLAQHIVTMRPQAITLVSLARAGTPIGILLKHILKRYYRINTPHYSVSILRDVGLDMCALRYLVRHHSPESLVFVDGWTGKGTIAKQLTDSLRIFATTDGIVIPDELYVLTDLSGSATASASCYDYLIPSCLLNATVSGLISRTLVNKNNEASDFHGCVYYDTYKTHDLSQYFIDKVLAEVELLSSQTIKPSHSHVDRPRLRAISEQFLQTIADRYGVSHYNYIKPGIGESTRVLLRRKARLLLLREAHNESTQHLRWLAHSKSVPIAIHNDLPYHAAALIQEVSR